MKTTRSFFISSVASLAGVMLLVTSSPAEAKPDYSGLSDSGRAVLQSFRSYMDDCKPSKAPEGAAVQNCNRIVGKQRKRLDRIKGDDRNHKLYKKYVAYQKRLEKAHAGWTADRKAKKERAGELTSVATEMRKEISKHSSTLWFLNDIAKGKKRSGIATVDPIGAAKKLKAAQSLKSFAASCKGKYAEVLADSTALWHASNDRSPEPKRACELASDWKKHMSVWFPKAVKTHSKRIADAYTGYIKDLNESGKSSNSILASLTKKAVAEDVKKTTKGFRTTGKALGIDVTAESFNQWNSIVKKAPAAIKKASKTRRNRSKAKNSKVTRAAKKRMKGSKLTFKKIGLHSKQGKIKKNGAGVPLRRVWRGELLAKKKGDKFCRQYRIEVTADYKGGGRYLAPVVKLPGHTFQVAACK